MSYKSLLVYVNDPQHDARAMNTASSVAAQFDAHLTALFVHDPIYYRYPLLYNDFPNAADEVREDNKHTQATRTAFERSCEAYGAVKTNWQFVTGETLHTVSMHARYADAVLTSQANVEHPPDSLSADPDLPAKLAIASARPVVSVPFTGEMETIGRRILVAWNDSREAARAVTAALPFLSTAERVNILAVDPETDSKGNWPDPGSDVALYLARHGVNVEAIHVESGVDSVSETLLWSAMEMEADLICMGAYGHSRLRELALGGVTRQIVRDSSLPLLLAH